MEGHLDYLGKVIQKWRLYGWSNWQNEEVQQAFEMRCDDAVKPDIPMYSTAHGLLMAPPEPSQEDVEDEADPVKAKRKFLRNMQTRLATLRKNMAKKSDYEIAEDESLLNTFEGIVAAKKSYMFHRDRCT